MAFPLFAFLSWVVVIGLEDMMNQKMLRVLSGVVIFCVVGIFGAFSVAVYRCITCSPEKSKLDATSEALLYPVPADME